MPDATNSVFQNCINLARKIQQKCHVAEAECEELVISLNYLRDLDEVRQRERIDQDFSTCRTFPEAVQKYLTENKISEANALEIFTALQRGNFGRAKQAGGWSKFWAAVNSHNIREPLEVVTGGSNDRNVWVVRLRPSKK